MPAYGTIAGASALVPASYMMGQEQAPINVQVNAWLEQGYAVINRTLVDAGYAIPISTGAAFYAELVALNNLYAAAHILRSRGLDTMTGQEETRSEVWLRDFNEHLQSLAKSNLGALGATPGAPSGSSATRQRLRTMQMRRVDGYSAKFEESASPVDIVSE